MAILENAKLTFIKKIFVTGTSRKLDVSASLCQSILTRKSMNLYKRPPNPPRPIFFLQAINRKNTRVICTVTCVRLFIQSHWLRTIWKCGITAFSHFVFYFKALAQKVNLSQENAFNFALFEMMETGFGKLLTKFHALQFLFVSK